MVASWIYGQKEALGAVGYATIQCPLFCSIWGVICVELSQWLGHSNWLGRFSLAMCRFAAGRGEREKLAADAEVQMRLWRGQWLVSPGGFHQGSPRSLRDVNWTLVNWEQ